jgi:predicted RNA-binding protein with PUA domain
MSEYHDLILMCVTAGGIFGAIRFDLKFIRYRMGELEKSFKNHMDKFHKVP